MKKFKSGIFIAAFLISGLLLTNCSKDDNLIPASTDLTSDETGQVENADVQDAVAEQITQDIDNTADELQNSSYQTDDLSSARITGGSRTITVDHPDSTTFPKMVRIVYNNWSDSTAIKTFIKNGEIDIIVNCPDPQKRLITREYTFKNFSITTDSTIISVSGTRTMTRQNDSIYWDPTRYRARMMVSDRITANLAFTVKSMGSNDSSTFTRIVDKTREGIFWYRLSFRHMHMFGRHLASNDTITWTGSVSGVNENGLNYQKLITEPLIMHAYRGTLVIMSGKVDFTGGSENTAFSYEFSYQQQTGHPFVTEVTVTNNLNGTSKTFQRRWSRRFVRW